MEELLKEIMSEAIIFEENSSKGITGNKAAARRARKSALLLIKQLKEFRKQSNEQSKK